MIAQDEAESIWNNSLRGSKVIEELKDSEQEEIRKVKEKYYLKSCKVEKQCAEGRDQVLAHVLERFKARYVGKTIKAIYGSCPIPSDSIHIQSIDSLSITVKDDFRDNTTIDRIPLDKRDSFLLRMSGRDVGGRPLRPSFVCGLSGKVIGIVGLLSSYKPELKVLRLSDSSMKRPLQELVELDSSNRLDMALMAGLIVRYREFEKTGKKLSVNLAYTRSIQLLKLPEGSFDPEYRKIPKAFIERFSAERRKQRLRCCDSSKIYLDGEELCMSYASSLLGVEIYE